MFPAKWTTTGILLFAVGVIGVNCALADANKDAKDDKGQKAARQRSAKNLRDLMKGLHSYHDANEHFPPAAIYDKSGKPLLSWRVLLLPYIDQNDLFARFHLDEPWDSTHNKTLLAKMPNVYHGPNRKLNQEGKTIFLLPVGKNAAFKDGQQGPRFPADFTDGTSNTIFIVEADDGRAVPWTKPEDLKIDPAHPERGLGGHFPQGFLAALADGSARLISKTISKATLRNAFDPNDGRPLGRDW